MERAAMLRQNALYRVICRTQNRMKNDLFGAKLRHNTRQMNPMPNSFGSAVE